MVLLVRLATYGAIFLIGGFAAVVAWKILSGGISLDGLLDGSGPGGARAFSAGRLQLLIVTVVSAAQYLSAVWHNPHRDSLPPVPQGLLAVQAASSLFYLGGKTLDQYIPLLRKLK